MLTSLAHKSTLVIKTGHFYVRSRQMERSRFLPAANEGEGSVMGNLRITSFDNRWAYARSLKTSFIFVMPGQIPSRSTLKWSSAPDFSTLLVSFLTPFPSIVKEQVILLSLPMKHSPLSASVKSFWRGTPTGSEWVLALPAPLMDLNDSAPRDDHGKAWHSHWVYIPATLHRFLQTRKFRIQRSQWTERWITWRWCKLEINP